MTYCQMAGGLNYKRADKKDKIPKVRVYSDFGLGLENLLLFYLLGISDICNKYTII